MIFIETPNFTADVLKLQAEDQLAALQNELIENPTKGDLIQNSGGFRKIRMSGHGKGKSGGYRVIYYLVTKEAILLTYLYPKNKQVTLTPEQLKRLKSIIT